MKLTDISEAGLFVDAKFARLNKQNTLTEYREEIAGGKGDAISRAPYV